MGKVVLLLFSSLPLTFILFVEILKVNTSGQMGDITRDSGRIACLMAKV